MQVFFVLMPFRYQEMNDFYRKNIRPIFSEKNGSLSTWKCIRADEVNGGTALITQEIISKLEDSDVILADLTTLNPNVFYELGVAHAFGTNVLMICEEGHDIPFDLKNHKVFIYKKDAEGVKKLKDYIRSSLKNLSWSKKTKQSSSCLQLTNSKSSRFQKNRRSIF